MVISYKPKSALARDVAGSGEYPGANDDEARRVDKLVEALELALSVAEDCRQRWSRGHEERVGSAKATLIDAKG